MKVSTRINNWLLSLIIRFKGSKLFLNSAIARAKRLHASNGKRYRVFFIENKYQALTRIDIQLRKHSGKWGWHVNSTSMQPYCFYDTTNTGVPKFVNPANL